MFRANHPLIPTVIVPLVFAGVTIARDDPPGPRSLPARFSDATVQENCDVATDATMVRRDPVAIDVRRMRDASSQVGATLLFGLFDDVRFTAIVERVERRSANSYTAVGRLVNEPNGSFALAVENDVMVGNIRVPSRQALYQIRYLGQGVHVVRQIDESQFSPCANADFEPVAPIQPGGERRLPTGCDDDGSVIDVLVVYTPWARASACGADSMNALIDLAIVESNTAYANSLINTQLRLVHKALIEYDEAGTYSDHLHRLTGPDDGYMDEVHTWRDLYHADMVSLLVADGGYCGIAWLIRDMVSPDAETYAFSVVKDTCATGYYTLAHELGHNQGCHHDRANAGGPGIYDYSYGYQEPEELFRTVMAYNCPGGCPRIQYFSNPDVTYLGLPTGVPVGEPEAAHNTLTINNTAFTIANFRRFFDCNDNGVCDDIDIAQGVSEDCNSNGTPDECDFDCNGNGVPDDCDIAAGTSVDCNNNGVPDECLHLEIDCNENGVPDECDLAGGSSDDCNENGVPDDCEGDCNNNGSSDFCDVLDGTSPDANGSGYPDECEPPVLFVDADATGINSGLSWADAFDDLQTALTIAANSGGFVDEIWVTAGTYVPSKEREPGRLRTATFQLINGVGIYGGFSGGETDRDQRDPTANATILSGDFFGDDEPSFINSDENAWHVVTGSNTDETAVLDGFTITRGNSNGPRDNTYTTAYHTGGNMFISDGSPTIVNCTVAAGTAGTVVGHHAGGLSVHGGSPRVINCSFIGNYADFAAGMYASHGSPVLINCTFLLNGTGG